ncbi:hypothetical protein AB5I41_04510 [Sphingomonas sp. MMS24-JH45]
MDRQRPARCGDRHHARSRGGGGAEPSVDGIAAGAFRKRAAFADARLLVGGGSPLAGDWRISGVPVFDTARGHFIGYRGAARRPHVEEDAVRALVRRDPRDGRGDRAGWSTNCARRPTPSRAFPN